MITNSMMTILKIMMYVLVFDHDHGDTDVKRVPFFPELDFRFHGNFLCHALVKIENRMGN